MMLKIVLEYLIGPFVPRPLDCPTCHAALASPSLICTACGNDAAWKQWADFVRTLESEPHWSRAWHRRQLDAQQRAYVDALLFLAPPEACDSAAPPPEPVTQTEKKRRGLFSSSGLISLFKDSGNLRPRRPDTPDGSVSPSPAGGEATSGSGLQEAPAAPTEDKPPAEAPEQAAQESEEARTSVCPSCGQTNLGESLVCSRCGRYLDEEAASSPKKNWRESVRRSESKRKKVFSELTRAYERAKREAAKKYPTDPSVAVAWQENVYKQIDKENALRDRYERQVAKKYGVTVDELRSIALEGEQKSWPASEA